MILPDRNESPDVRNAVHLMNERRAKGHWTKLHINPVPKRGPGYDIFVELEVGDVLNGINQKATEIYHYKADGTWFVTNHL